MKINLSDSRLFNKVYLPLLRDTNRYLLLYGSRDSAKSYFAAQKVLIDTMSKSYSRYVLLRKIYSDIKDSQFQTIKDIIHSYGLTDLFTITENPLKITFNPNGNYILARGLDKEYKLKSITNVTSIFYEEFNEIKFSDFLKSTSSLRGGVIQEIACFNPEMEDSWITNYFFPPKESYEREDGNFHFVPSIRKDTTILHTTYKDNKFVTNQSIELLESFKDVDYRYYRIYTLGLWGGALDGVIYSNWDVVDSFPNEEVVYYGLDFGYSNDESGLVKVCFQGDDLFVEEVFYQKGLTNQDIAEKLREKGINENQLIIADSAEPKSIQELYREGFAISGAIKGPDSIRNGIDILKRYKIHVVRGSSNLIRELKSYCWAMDRDGKSLNVPIDKLNHLLDPLRYVALFKNYVPGKRMVKVGSV
ncbi:MAG: PBSX family phage terminase large subunit [Bacteroidales bacterium]